MVVITSCEADDCSADYLLDVSALYGTWKFITKLYYRRTQSGGTQQLRIGVQSIEVVGGKKKEKKFEPWPPLLRFLNHTQLDSL
jgi:hypothetical protein